MNDNIDPESATFADHVDIDIKVRAFRGSHEQWTEASVPDYCDAVSKGVAAYVRAEFDIDLTDDEHDVEVLKRP